MTQKNKNTGGNRSKNGERAQKERKVLAPAKKETAVAIKPKQNQLQLNNTSEKKREDKKTLVTRKTVMARCRFALFIIIFVFAFLCYKLVSLQLIDKNDYKNTALGQYVEPTVIPAKRGNIYDRNMIALAQNATVQNVILSPYDIKQSKKYGAEESEETIITKIADKMSQLFDDVDKDVLASRIRGSNSKWLPVNERPANRAIDKDKATIVNEFIKENRYSRYIYLEEGTKRTYPYGTLASHVIGFCRDDGVGNIGLEKQYNSDLSGINGKKISGKDGTGNELAFKYQSYVEATDGYNLVTTIDVDIQAVLEKYLKEAFEDNGAENRVAGIIMDVNTGEIYGDAVYPDFDLNAPREFPEYYQKILDKYIESDGKADTFGLRLLDTSWSAYLKEENAKKEQSDENDEKTENDKNDEKERLKEKFKEYLQNTMWNNKTVTEPYEPGSTFKIVTAAVALELGVVKESDTYECKNGIDVGGQHINCHKRDGHGVQSFARTLQNSCNPAFVTWGQKIGEEKFMQYFNEFGFTGKTGGDLLGESDTIYYKTTGVQFGEAGLATYSFGQTFKTTMLQQIRAVSVVANGGKLITPHVAKELRDSNGNVIKSFETNVERSVISEEVSNKIVEILFEGAQMGTTKNATVSGYDIAAKTGTSQKIELRAILDEEKYISSCVAFAPAKNPQIAILIVIDEPTGTDFYGGLVAAPVVSKILSEVLPHLGIERSGDETVFNIKLDDYRGADIDEAKINITNLGLNYKVIGDGTTVLRQMPEKGATMIADGEVPSSTVFLYTDLKTEAKMVTVPDLIGRKPKNAEAKLKECGLNIKISGSYSKYVDGEPFARSQSIKPGESVPEGTVVEVEFRYTGIVG